MFKLSYSKKQIIINVLKIAIVFFVLLLVIYFSLGWSVKEIISRKSWLDPKVIAIVIVFVLGFLLGVIELKFLEKLGRFFDKTIFALRNAIKGNLGEKKTFERLSSMLGDSYRLHRNFKIPNTRFDIDTVIVGPKGIITFEIKNLGGSDDKFRFEGNDVYKVKRYQNGNVCFCQLNYLANPVNEALRHNQALEEWLMKNDFEKIKIKGALLMVGNSKIEGIEHPSIFIITSANGLKDYIDRAFEDSRFTEEYCDKLNRLFETN